LTNKENSKERGTPRERPRNTKRKNKDKTGFLFLFNCLILQSASNPIVDSSWGQAAELEHQANNRKKERLDVPKRDEAPLHPNPAHSNPAHPIPVVATSPAPNAHHDREVPHWAVEDVQNWLQESGFSVLCRKFKEHDIDGEALLLMHFEDLKELNINLGIRLRLWSRIEEIGGQVRPGGNSGV
jgi:hypothetical protein